MTSHKQYKDILIGTINHCWGAWFIKYLLYIKAHTNLTLVAYTTFYNAGAVLQQKLFHTHTHRNK